MRLLKCWGGIVHTQNKQSIYKKIDQKSSAAPRTMRVVFIYTAGCPTAPVPAAAGHAPSSPSGILHPCAKDLPCPCPGGVPYPGSSRSKEWETSSSERMPQLKSCLKKIPPQNEKKIILEVKTALICVGGNLTELPELLVMSNTTYSNKSDFPFTSHSWASKSLH